MFMRLCQHQFAIPAVHGDGGAGGDAAFQNLAAEHGLYGVLHIAAQRTGTELGVVGFVHNVLLGCICQAAGMDIDKEDGEYSIQVDLEGGSGKASVTSPTILTVKDGQAYAQIQWSSSNYDYMIVDGEKYLPTNEEGMNSVFEIPVLSMDEGMPVIADTTAMGAPHEIDYTLTFYSDSIGSKSQLPQEAAKRVVAVAVVIIVGGGILNYFVNKRNRC